MDLENKSVTNLINSWIQKQIEKTGGSVIIKKQKKDVLNVNKKVYNDVMSGKSDNSIHFADFQNLIVDLGFEYIRQNGSHRQYYNREINERMTIQNDKSKAKGGIKSGN